MLLVDTSNPDTPGSMLRYANLVEASLNLAVMKGAPVKCVRLKLSLQNRLPEWASSWISARFKIWLDHAWFQFGASRRIRKSTADLVHVLDGSYAYLIDGQHTHKTIVTTHDLIPVMQQAGQFGHLPMSFLARAVVRKSIRGLRNAQLLVAVSESTKLDLLQWIGIEHQKVIVISNALDPEWQTTAHQLSARDLPSHQSVLHVGNNSHYKNREGVVRIFAHLRKHHEAGLVMAGPPPGKQLLELVKSLNLSEQIYFVENPDQDELARLYASASVLLFPSIYEGFGWPPLEAMAFGCPVVCSDAASLPEVVGDAALMAPAQNEEELARLCALVLSDPALAERLGQKGRAHAAGFTLEKMGKQLIDAYEAALNA